MLEKHFHNIVDNNGNDMRLLQLKNWLEDQLGVRSLVIKPASEDASFRRYFRVWTDNATYVAMDAPPDKEDCVPFIDIAYRLRLNNINAPAIYARDLENGFLLLDDLGSTSYLSALDSRTVAALYGDALHTLLCMQKNIAADDLPAYNRRLLLQEMELFVEWFLHRHLQIKITEKLGCIIYDAFELLIASALEQPNVFVHRDFHSRNLMVCNNNNPGVLDFQDAVYGPITYDLVSLLRDCYISWPTHQVQKWLKLYYERLAEHHLVNVDFVKFERWFDWMGMQRHLKAIGIFARLNHRDGKPNFLKDIPRTWEYVAAVCKYYPDFMSFSELMAKLRIHERLPQ